MILGANQPYFIPYIGYWQLINAVDIFVIADDYNYIKNGWISRNRILSNGLIQYFNIEIKHASQNKKINELFRCDISTEKKLGHLICSYRKAPYFEDGILLMKDILTCPEMNLAEYLTYSIKCICDFLEIKTKMIKSSQLDHNSDLKREYRIYDMCKRLGADQYYNAIGGEKLYSFQEFEKEGIRLNFIKRKDEISYKQFNNSFVPDLSIIDVIMFNSKNEIKQMLKQYSLTGFF